MVDIHGEPLDEVQRLEIEVRGDFHALVGELFDAKKQLEKLLDRAAGIGFEECFHWLLFTNLNDVRLYQFGKLSIESSE